MKKTSSKKIKQYFFLFIKALYKTIRMQLGPPGVCIYSVSCSIYAKNKIKQKPFYIAIPLVALRVLSCNPITAIILRTRNKKVIQLCQHELYKNSSR